MQLLLALAAVASLVSAAPAPTGPVVTLTQGKYTGISASGINSFLGINFATAPRFRLPVPLPPSSLSFDASKFGPAVSFANLRLGADALRFVLELSADGFNVVLTTEFDFRNRWRRILDSAEQRQGATVLR